MQMIVGMAWKMALGALLVIGFHSGIDISVAGTKALAAQSPGQLQQDPRPAPDASVASLFGFQESVELKLPGIRDLVAMTQENFRKVSDVLRR